MNRLLLIVLFLIPSLARAGTLIALDGGSAFVARDGSVEEWTSDRRLRTWHGVEAPLAIAVTDDVVIVSAIDGGVVAIERASGRKRALRNELGTITAMLETPRGVIALAGQRGALGVVESAHVAPVVEVGRDSAGLRLHGGSLYVTSRAERTVSRVSLEDGSVLARVSSAGVAADLEVDSSGVYLTYPLLGQIEILDEETLASRELFRLGSAPADLALRPAGTPIGAGTFFVADPAAGAIVADERSQSATASFFRAFLRGFLGLGLARAEAFRPDGRPDRVVTNGTVVWSQDSVSGTIWRITGRSIIEIGRADPGAYAVADNGTLIFMDAAAGTLRWYDPD